MKIRSGFVSNSSSSSFILKFDKLPESVEEVKVLLFGENPPLLTTYWGDDAVSTQQIAEVLFRDINSARIMGVDGVVSQVREQVYFSKYSVDEGRELVSSEYLEEFDRLYKMIEKEDEEHSKRRLEYNDDDGWDAHYKKMDKLSEPLYDIVEKSIKEKCSDLDKYIEVEYGDGEGMVFSYLEHSGILDKIKIQRFSHH